MTSDPLDAEIEAAISRYGCFCAAEIGDGTKECIDRTQASLGDLRALIARRVQQATAAAEDLARAVEFALEPGPLDGKEVAMTAEIRIAARALRQEKAERLRTALAAFRKAQGGA